MAEEPTSSDTSGIDGSRGVDGSVHRRVSVPGGGVADSLHRRVSFTGGTAATNGSRPPSMKINVGAEPNGALENDIGVSPTAVGFGVTPTNAGAAPEINLRRKSIASELRRDSKVAKQRTSNLKQFYIKRFSTLMPELVIKNVGEDMPEMTECESSHEYLVRPGVSPALKFLVSPCIIILQFLVFALIYKNLAVTSCTDYSSWQPDVKYGIPLASIWIASEIATQIVMSTRMLLAGLYSGSPWTVFWSMVLIGQFCFETQVYATVMASALNLQELIQNFVALAVTNEADDKVASALGVEGAKVMFMDIVEEEQECDLMNELEHPKGSSSKPSLKARTAVKFLWFVHDSHGWKARIFLIFGALAALISSTVMLWTKACSVNIVLNNPYYHDCEVYHAVTDTTLKEYLAAQGMTYADFFTANETISIDDETVYNFDLNVKDGFPYFSSGERPISYMSASLSSNGLLKFNSENERWNVLPIPQPGQDSVIAPFFADLAPVTGQVYVGTRNAEEVFIIYDEVEVVEDCMDLFIADGYCDEANNNDRCYFDGGDCCEETCGMFSKSDFETGFDHSSTAENVDYSSLMCASFADCSPEQPKGVTSAAQLIVDRSLTINRISFELVLSKTGFIRISFPPGTSFEPPDSNEFTIGFQWETLAGITPLSSQCMGLECIKYYNMGAGDSILLRPFEEAGSPSSTSLLFVERFVAETLAHDQVVSFICNLEDFQNLGDGKCDNEVHDGNDPNSAACGWDQGDCCEHTCISSEFFCGDNDWSHCLDPCAEDSEASHCGSYDK